MVLRLSLYPFTDRASIPCRTAGTEMVPLVPIYVAGLFGLVVTVPAEYYATKYDHIDIEMILNNRRMVNYYTACMLNKGPCPPEGLEFKRILPEAIRTNCKKCTEKQKTVTLRSIKRLMKEYPKIWAQLQKEWDPDGSLTAKFIATYGSRESIPAPVVSLKMLNKLGGIIEETIDNNTLSMKKTSTSTSTSGTSTFASVTTGKTIVSQKKINNKSAKPTSSTKKIITSTKSVTLVNKVTTNAPIASNTFTNFHSSPNRFRPLANIGAGIEATVKMVKSVEKSIWRITKEKFRRLNNFLTG
ncbi:chemosensory protein 6 isoform X2 [Leptinotarsa decemlineata]|uniref:chemosensory protein 6 isoform X2 n=1 Tax=Leptinotarsa decemlineata TaxID=7539 RepID=UPI003D30BA0F